MVPSPPLCSACFSQELTERAITVSDSALCVGFMNVWRKKEKYFGPVFPSFFGERGVFGQGARLLI